MTITAKIVCDSVSPEGVRLTTLQLRYPKFIHGEFMTHRVFSRNASSSRAIPVERLIQDVLDDPAMPMFWGKNQPGMQAAEELDEFYKDGAVRNWLTARDAAVGYARNLHALGAHKQLVNRIIEPWCHINVVITATEWANFFALRCHPAAQPEMRMLAETMRDALGASVPEPLKSGEWHLPYLLIGEIEQWACDQEQPYDRSELAVKVSVARCARVSYLTHEGRAPDVAADLALYDRLVGGAPLHASPAEHQATPDEITTHAVHCASVGWLRPEQHGNFTGWRQYRKMLPNENVRDR